MKHEKLKEILSRAKELKINQVIPIEDTLNKLINYIERVEKENERLRNELSSYSKEEEVAKLKEECNRLNRHSLYILNDEEKRLSDEFYKEHYEKCGRGCYIQYVLTPSGVGTSVEVQCAHCKEVKNITDYSSF